MRTTGVKGLIHRTPMVREIIRRFYALASHTSFRDSAKYWDRRYRRGGSSGPGSYGSLAGFKAEVLNGFVNDRDVRSVIEFGVGDGHQLGLANYPAFVGIDVSPAAIELCRERFQGDETKGFIHLDEYDGRAAELALSLDVIYHLVEDHVFNEHLSALFGAAERFVVIYSSNTDDQPAATPAHVRHREFLKWVEENASGWDLTQHIPNIHPPVHGPELGSMADFYIFERSE